MVAGITFWKKPTNATVRHKHRIHQSHEELIISIGSVIRVSPKELSFASAPAWKAIYSPRGRNGVAKIAKGEFYDGFGAGMEVQSMGTERDPFLAAQKRDLFSEALSVQGLQTQESVMQDNINQWVKKLGELGSGEKGMDMQKWFIYLGFDLTGAMSFGESFGCVERGAFSQYHYLC